MVYKATELAFEQLNKDRIKPEDILVDRAIIKNDLNPLMMMAGVAVELDGKDKVKMHHPLDDFEKRKYFEIEYNGVCWQKK